MADSQSSGISLLTSHALVLVFGLSSWLLVNAVWVELALIVETAPEGYAIASYMAIALQCANIFPLAYSMAARKRDPPLPYHVTITAIGLLGAGSCLLLAWYWHVTAPAWPGGEPRSVVLIGLLFVGGALDCTSSVVYWPWVSQFDEAFTSSLATGESLSGSIPALIGVAQVSADGKATLSVEAFFYSMAAIQAISLGSFLWFKKRQGAWSGHEEGGNPIQALALSSRSLDVGACPPGGVKDNAPHDTGDEGEDAQAAHTAVDLASRGDDDDGTMLVTRGVAHGCSEREGQSAKRGDGELWHVCAQPVLVEALLKFVVDGLAPSLCPFAAAGYASPKKTLMWCIVLSNLSRPIGAHLTTYPSLRSRRIANQAAAWLITWTFVIYAAFSYRAPPFRAYPWALGAVWVGGAGLAGYAHAMLFVEIALRCREGGFGAEGKRVGYRWAGMSTQGGAFAGTLVAFWLVNLSGWFSY